MDENISLTCPKCEKRMKVRPDLAGKKIRCPGCERVIEVPALPPTKKAPVMTKKAPELKKKVPAPAPAPGAKTAKKNSGEGEFDDQNPYGITDLDLTPRCPHCAAELESPDVVLCVECGYNLATREHMKMVKAIETTSGEQFKWLLPGILCAIGVLALIGFDLFWCLVLPDMIDADSYLAYVTTPAINLWIVIGSLFGMFALGAYAVKRLILNPIAPEKTKAS